MSFSVNEKKELTIFEILSGNENVILSNIDILAKDYLEKKGKKLNKGCSSCINEMILTLKNYYNMTQFKFKKHAASYKNKKGDTTTISNATMTDEKAIEFLRTNPERIVLFSDFPENWEQLLIADLENDEETEKRIAIEAEKKAIKDSKKTVAKKPAQNKKNKSEKDLEADAIAEAKNVGA